MTKQEFIASLKVLKFKADKTCPDFELTLDNIIIHIYTKTDINVNNKGIYHYLNSYNRALEYLVNNIL